MKKYKPGDLLVNNSNKCRYIVVTSDEWLRNFPKGGAREINRRFSKNSIILFALGSIRGFHDRFTYLAYDKHGIGEKFFTKIEI